MTLRARRTRDRELVFGIALGGLLLLRRKQEPVAWGDGWWFPVPDLASHGVEFPAMVTSGFRTSSRPNHHGVDIMYRATASKPVPPTLDRFTGATRNIDSSVPPFFAPPTTPVLAARAGNVWSVGETERGIMIVLDHGRPWATMYIHLESTPLAPHARGRELASNRVTTVAAGDVIGVMGGDPRDTARLRHLHFEAWYKGAGPSAAQDPAPVMRFWGRSSFAWP